jgi:processive 1,2-diacylglycerol beta-glucosyltransferase
MDLLLAMTVLQSCELCRLRKPRKLFIMKILIASLSVGAGHMQAAKALQKTIKQLYPDVECQVADLYDYMGYAFKQIAVTSYDIMAKRIPELWGYFFDMTNTPKTSTAYDQFIDKLKQINAYKWYEFVQKFRPDHIICTHFLPAELCQNAPAKYKYKGPFSMVVTDYDIHNLWFVEGTTNYFVATEKMKWKILNRKCKKQPEIIVSGIPIDPEFYTPTPQLDIRKAHHIPSHLPIILVLSGGHGMAKSCDIVKTLFKMQTPCAIIAIAGTNENLKEQLSDIRVPKHINYTRIGWTDRMSDYIKSATEVISKPGGLTTTECMVTGTPIIAIDPIPGQEEYNTDFILEKNLGRIAKTEKDLLYYTDVYLTDSKQKKNQYIATPAAVTILTNIITGTN